MNEIIDWKDVKTWEKALRRCLMKAHVYRVEGNDALADHYRDLATIALMRQDKCKGFTKKKKRGKK